MFILDIISHIGLESSEGMAGGGHDHIFPQHGEFSTNAGGEGMVLCRSIHASQRHTSRALRGSGTESGAKGSRDDPAGGPECADGRPT